ncbi:fungal-specific transcription factor domain-containing protein [Umbelopsis sp. AD052]|nr:fungal-specific transcription factor domain-containing protein [Umbelopsis sp. AD052]
MPKKVSASSKKAKDVSPDADQPKRFKVTLACVVCRKKKVKCDGVQPACSRCNSMGISCEYTDPPRKRGPPKGYVEVIENRAHRIESLLGRGHLSGDQDHPAWKSAKLIHRASISNNMATPNRLPQRHSISAPSPAITGADIIPFPNVLGKLGENGMVSSLAPSPVNTFFDLLQNGVHQLAQCNAPSTSECEILAPEVSDALVDSYFTHFNQVFPVLSKPHFVGQMKQGPSSVDPLLLNAVYATGAQYCRVTKPDMPVNADFFITRCRVLLEENSEEATMSRLQALVILCWVSFLLGQPRKCLKFQDLALAYINELNIWHDTENDSQTSSQMDMEMRRRLYWALYINDRWVATTLALPCKIIEPYTSCKLPMCEDDELWAETQNLNSETDAEQEPLHDHQSNQMMAFAQTIKLARLVGDINRQFYSPTSRGPCSAAVFASMDASLTHWLLNLPRFMQYEKPTDDTPPSPVSRLFHMLYYTVQILLHRPNQSLSAQLNPSQQMSLNICSSATKSITHIGEEMIRYNQTAYLFNTFVFSVTTGCSVHLEALFAGSSQNSVAAKINLRRSLRVLGECSRSFMSSENLEIFVSRLLERCEVSLDEENDGEEPPAHVAAGDRRLSIKRPMEDPPNHRQPKRSSVHLEANPEFKQMAARRYSHPISADPLQQIPFGHVMVDPTSPDAATVVSASSGWPADPNAQQLFTEMDLEALLGTPGTPSMTSFSPTWSASANMETLMATAAPVTTMSQSMTALLEDTSSFFDMLDAQKSLPPTAMPVMTTTTTPDALHNFLWNGPGPESLNSLSSSPTSSSGPHSPVSPTLSTFSAMNAQQANAFQGYSKPELLLPQQTQHQQQQQQQQQQQEPTFNLYDFAVPRDFLSGAI